MLATAAQGRGQLLDDVKQRLVVATVPLTNSGAAAAISRIELGPPDFQVQSRYALRVAHDAAQLLAPGLDLVDEPFLHGPGVRVHPALHAVGQQHLGGRQFVPALDRGLG